MNQPIVWFTHKGIWRKPSDNYKPKWSDELKNWNWNNCQVYSQRKSLNEITVIIRSTGEITSELTEQKHLIRFAYNFEVSDIPKPIEDVYEEPKKNNTLNSNSGTPKSRWVLFLNRTEKNVEHKECCIWQWSHEDGQRKIHEIYEKLTKTKSGIAPKRGIIEEPNESIPYLSPKSPIDVRPIIYQPAIDTMKNFIRQVHIHKCSEKNNEYEITIVFNNEQLRRNKIFNKLYEEIRLKVYGRLKDVETFHVILNNYLPTKFVFEGIYSNGKGIKYDDVHGDRRFWNIFPRKKRKIDYYYSSSKHPKVFINTSNHAMAGYDNNPGLWKWEYPTSEENGPIIVGELSRVQVLEYIQQLEKDLKKKEEELSLSND